MDGIGSYPNLLTNTIKWNILYLAQAALILIHAMSFVLAAWVLMKNELLTIGALKKAFAEYGKHISNSWIRRQEEKGNLLLPRSSTNFKRAQGFRKPGAVREITNQQIEDILLSFLPKGTKLKNGKSATGLGYFNYLK